jgi:hypothetical protein
MTPENLKERVNRVFTNVIVGGQGAVLRERVETELRQLVADLTDYYQSSGLPDEQLNVAIAASECLKIVREEAEKTKANPAKSVCRAIEERILELIDSLQPAGVDVGAPDEAIDPDSEVETD